MQHGKLQPLALIVAWARRGVIGSGGALPWHEAEDLRWFKHHTMGHAILMGRKTYESIGRPLPGRRNIVISRQEGLKLSGCEVVPSLESAIERARETDRCPFVIGGGTIYEQALPLVTRMYVTFLDRDVPGDTYFPPFDEDEWEEFERGRSESGEMVFRILDRKQPAGVPRATQRA